MNTTIYKPVALFGLAAAACLPAYSSASSTASETEADMVLLDGRFFTGNPLQQWAQSLVVRNGKIVYVGEPSKAKTYIGEHTQVIRLGGRMAMSALVDGHVHPVLGGMEQASQCLFSSEAGPDKVKRILETCVKETAEGHWVEGGRWASTFFSEYDIQSPIDWLDQISSKHPISLADDTGHNRWVNSMALQRAGLDASSQIEGGELLLSSDGQPTGLLLELAFVPVLAAIERDTRPTARQYQEAAWRSITDANRFGITAFKEAGDSHHAIEAYVALAEQGRLNAHVAACISVPFTEKGDIDFQRLEKIRIDNAREQVNTDCVKLFLDGVPSEVRTAAVLANYRKDPHGNVHKGKLLIPPRDLNRYVVELDSMGFTIKIHAAGDRSVRVSLDAIAQARKENPRGNKAHELAHSGFIDPADIARFVELNVVADMSPAIWFPSLITDSIIRAMGERGRRYWPFKTLLERDVKMLVGTDWPAVVPDMNPWPGIEAMVTRQNPHKSSDKSLWLEQSIPLEDALYLYTLGSAKALALEEDIGSLEVGKSADIIVLDRHVFDVPARDVGETQVVLTLFKGRPVHQAKSFIVVE